MRRPEDFSEVLLGRDLRETSRPCSVANCVVGFPMAVATTPSFPCRGIAHRGAELFYALNLNLNLFTPLPRKLPNFKRGQDVAGAS